MGGAAGHRQRLHVEALLEPIEPLPQADASANHDRDDDEIEVVNQVGLQERAQRRRPAADPNIEIAGRLAGHGQGFGR